MRRLLLAAAGLATLVTVALAQTPAAPGQGPGMAPPPPPPGRHGRGGPGMPPPPPPSRAAHLHLERGDAIVDVKCADDDGTKACADIVSALLDKLAGMPAGAASGAAAPAPSRP